MRKTSQPIQVRNEKPGLGVDNGEDIDGFIEMLT